REAGPRHGGGLHCATERALDRSHFEERKSTARRARLLARGRPVLVVPFTRSATPRAAFLSRLKLTMNHTAPGRPRRQNPMFRLALAAAVAAVFSALAALATVVVSFHIGKQHVQNARQQIENAAQQTDEARTVVQNAARLLSVQVTREFRDEFDSVGMQRRRMATASALLKGTTPPTANVLDFFESLGNYVQKGVLDKEVVWNEFREEVFTIGRQLG